MKRGYADAVTWVELKTGDVWKFGTTKNPLTRYSQKFMNEIRLNFESLSSGTLEEALAAEKASIMNYLEQNGILPPGNKIIK